MATRLNLRQAETARAAIQATRLIEVLQKSAFGESKMSMSAIRSAEILIKISIPQLSSVQIDTTDSETMPVLKIV